MSGAQSIAHRAGGAELGPELTASHLCWTYNLKECRGQ